MTTTTIHIKLMSGDLVPLSLSSSLPCSEVYHLAHHAITSSFPSFASFPHWALTLFLPDGGVLHTDYDDIVTWVNDDVLSAFYECTPFRVRFEYIGVGQDPYFYHPDGGQLSLPYLCYDLHFTSSDETITQRFFIRLTTQHDFIPVIYSSESLVIHDTQEFIFRHLGHREVRIQFSYKEHAKPFSDLSLMLLPLKHIPYFSIHTGYRMGSIACALESAYQAVMSSYPTPAQNLPDELPPLDALLLP